MIKNFSVYGVDVDGVLRNTLPVMVCLYNNEFGTNLTTDDVTDWNIDKSFPLIREKLGYEKPDDWFFFDHAKEIFLESHQIFGAKAAIDELRNRGNKVIIITYQKNTENKIYTLQWLENNHITYDAICFTKDKSQVKCNVFIDDNDYNFTKCAADYAYLVTKPYNKDADVNELLKNSGSKTCKYIIRANSLYEIVFGEEKIKK